MLNQSMQVPNEFYWAVWALITDSVTICWNKKQPDFVQKIPKIQLQQIYLNSVHFKNSSNITKHQDYFCKKNCRQNLSKIAQPGHTDHRYRWAIPFPRVGENVQVILKVYCGRPYSICRPLVRETTALTNSAELTKQLMTQKGVKNWWRKIKALKID